MLAVPVNFTVTLPSGQKTTVAAVARLVPRHGVGDPLVRARLQGPPRLRLGLGRDRFPAALDADPPQHAQTRLTWRSTTATPRKAGRYPCPS